MVILITIAVLIIVSTLIYNVYTDVRKSQQREIYPLVALGYFVIGFLTVLLFVFMLYIKEIVL